MSPTLGFKLFVYLLFQCSLWSVLFFCIFFHLTDRILNWVNTVFSPSAWSSMWNSWLTRALKLQLAVQTLSVPKEDTCRKMRYCIDQRKSFTLLSLISCPLVGDWLPVLEQPQQLMKLFNIVQHAYSGLVWDWTLSVHWFPQTIVTKLF